ncbi:MAG TPA: chromate transporter [Chthoniobacterales bacterium]
MSPLTLTRLLLLFGSLSVLSIGGGNSIIPEMHLQAVKGYHWMTDRQFADVFAIAQSAPGPSVLIVTLIGYKAGLPGGIGWAVFGAVAATIAMIVPAGLLVYWVAQFWQKAEKSKWRHAVEKGFAPLAVGLILATAFIVSRSADHSKTAVALSFVCTLIFATTKINPLIIVAIGGLIGWLGWV